MLTSSRTTRREPILRSTRWPGPPRGGTLLRAALIAALLALAAGVLYAEQPPPTCPSAPQGAGPVGRSGPPGALDSSPSPPGPAMASGSGRSDDPGAQLPLPAGMVGVPIRLAEPAALAVVRPGARVDLLAVPAGNGSTRPTDPTLLASRVLVLDVVDADAAASSAALYLALRPDQAHQAIGQPAGNRFAIIVRP